MASKRNYHGLTDSGAFYRDRDEWMRFVASRDGWDASARLVCLYIALRANPQSPDPYPKQSTIARDLGISVATVKRAVSAAKDAKVIEVFKRRMGRGVKPVNQYRLIHPADADGAPMSRHKGRTHEPQNSGSAE